MSRIDLFVVGALGALGAASGCGMPDASSGDAGAAAAHHAKAPDALWAQFADPAPHAFIVELDTDRVSGERAAWAVAKQQLAAPGVRVVTEWAELPLAHVEATSADAALAVLDGAQVRAAYPVETLELADAESFPLMDQPAAAAAGLVGTGTSVAILDTGTNYTLPAFGSCTSPGVPAGCKVAFAQDFAPNDNSLDDNGHGTNVAGITLGVAPDTRILALDVFTGTAGYSTDIISAINWSIANQATYHIAAMNLSLGGGSSTTTCPSDAIGVALTSARAAGIAPVVASGNAALTTAIASPACSPAAISVGAVYDSNVGGLGYANCTDPTTTADQIACFSNSASFLTVLAPGALITAAGYTMAGTSQATPHVAGAIAVLRAAFPTETVDQTVARLTSTGKAIRDPRNGVTKPRIDLFLAAGSPGADHTPPTGTVAIVGAPIAVKAAAVTLALTATDDSGVASMCITNTTTCTTFVPFAATPAWTLAAGDGKKTVTVWLRDTRGNTTTATTSPTVGVILDATAPTNGAVTAAPSDGALALTWTGFADATSGVARYLVVGAAGATAPTNCAGTALYSGAAASFTATGLTNGARMSYRVCAVDAAGNVSTGATVSAVPVPETQAPVGTLSINGGGARTNSLTVLLATVATDASGVAQMCISETTTCTAYVAYTGGLSYKFAAADGTRTIRVWYRDTWGNTSAPVSASIVLDTTAPTGGVVTATAAVAQITLSWTAATDALSGVAGYVLVGNPGTVVPAAGCTTGTQVYLGTGRSFVHAVAAKATWTYRLCSLDGAGNTSAGSTVAIAAK